MQCMLKPHDSEKKTNKWASVSSDSCDLISISSRDLETPQYNFSSLSKDPTPSFEKCIISSPDSGLPSTSLSRCSISLSRNSKIASTDSTSCDSYDLISPTEEHNSDSDDIQPSISTEDQYEENKGNRFIPSRRKPYSMKDSAVRNRTLYERRQKNEEIEEKRTKEITELRKIFEKNNEIQENRNKLLQDLLKELQTPKNKI